MSSHGRKTDVDPEAVALHGQSRRAPLSQNNGREAEGCESYFSIVAIQHLLVEEEDTGPRGDSRAAEVNRCLGALSRGVGKTNPVQTSKDLGPPSSIQTGQASLPARTPVHSM